jgi:hypothetical protein
MAEGGELEEVEDDDSGYVLGGEDDRNAKRGFRRSNSPCLVLQRVPLTIFLFYNFLLEV